MQIYSLTRWSLALTLAGVLLASPADAQGKGKDKSKDRARPELVRREDSFKAREKALKREQKLREERLKNEEERLKDEYERRREALKRDRERYEARDDRWDLDDDRWDYGDDGRRRDVPPGWCKGKGNPHNTPENCGYGASRRDGRYDDRNEPYYGDRGGSYEREHQIFHDRHDRECRMRAAERPLDLQWQLRVRQECKVRHDDWHRRTGTRHG
jgi:hypothetical protein